MTIADRPTTGHAEVNGARLMYEVNGAGPALTLIHAGIADSRMWDDQLPALSRQHSVVRYDVRGFGHSSMPPGPYAHHADLAALLTHLGISRTAILGASMGSTIAASLTLAYPDLVSHLILVAARLSDKPPSALLRQTWDDADVAYEAGDTARAVELEQRLWVDGPGRSPGQVEPTVRERVRRMNTAIFGRAAEQEQGEEEKLNPPSHQRLAEIAVPTLVIIGNGDVPDVVENADELVTAIPNARKVILPGAHMVSMEQPDAFNDAVLTFLHDTT